MGNIKNTNEFLNYLGKQLDVSSIHKLYDSNQITIERCNLYRDFISTLVIIVFETYMGDEFTNVEERKEHFKWCWDKTVSNFKLEGIIFAPDEELYEYFLNFMSEVFYYIKGDKDNEVIERNIKKLWDYIFNYEIPKTRSDVDTFIEVYKMFDNSIEKGKKLGL